MRKIVQKVQGPLSKALYVLALKLKPLPGNGVPAAATLED